MFLLFWPAQFFPRCIYKTLFYKCKNIIKDLVLLDACGWVEMEIIWGAAQIHSMVSPEVLAACSRELLCLWVEYNHNLVVIFLSNHPTSIQLPTPNWLQLSNRVTLSALSLKAPCSALVSLYTETVYEVLHCCSGCSRRGRPGMSQQHMLHGVVALGVAFFAVFAMWLERDPTLPVSPCTELRINLLWQERNLGKLTAFVSSVCPPSRVLGKLQ